MNTQYHYRNKPLQDDNGLYCRPYLVQRMEAKNRNNQVQLGERYSFDYMGSAEFEVGQLGKTIRRMVEDNHIRIGSTFVYGVEVLVCFDERMWDFNGVQYALTQLWDGQWRTKERTEFDKESVRKYRKSRKLAPRDRERTTYTDAWFDIENGLFWTIEKINIRDIVLNLRKTVEWNNLSSEEQRERRHQELKLENDRAARQEAKQQEVDPLRQRMIDEGRLKPRKD